MVYATRRCRVLAGNVRGRAEDVGSQGAISLTSRREGLHVIIVDMWNFCKRERGERVWGLGEWGDGLKQYKLDTLLKMVQKNK